MFYQWFLTHLIFFSSLNLADVKNIFLIFYCHYYKWPHVDVYHTDFDFFKFMLFAQNAIILPMCWNALSFTIQQHRGTDMQWSPQACACCVYGHARHLPSVSYKGYQTGRAAWATKHLFPTLPLHVLAAVFKEPSEDGDTSRAASGTTVHVSLLIKRQCRPWSRVNVHFCSCFCH